MRKIGYARVSSKDQNLEVQKAALEKAGCAITLEEKHTGTRREGREQLELALKILNEGDVLVVTRLDRLGRSLRDLSNIVHEIESAGASLCVTEQAVDTTTTAGRAFFGMLAVFAQFETDVRSERQREGIRRAKGERRENGAPKYGGRPEKIDKEAIRKALNAGERPCDICRRMKVSPVTVWRARNEKGTK